VQASCTDGCCQCCHPVCPSTHTSVEGVRQRGALTYKNTASRGAYERLLREIDEAGYDYRAKVLNAADYGVPQSRPRLFVIGVKKGERLPNHPDPTHGGSWERRAPEAPTDRTSPAPRRSTAWSPTPRPKRSSAASTGTCSPASTR